MNEQDGNEQQVPPRWGVNNPDKQHLPPGEPPPVVPTDGAAPATPQAPAEPPTFPAETVAPQAPATPQAPVTPQAPATPPPVTPQAPATPLGHNIGATPPVISPTAGQATVVSGPAGIAAPAPGAPAGQPVLSSEYGLSQPPEAPAVPSKSSKAPWILAVIGALVLLGGGGFLAVNAFGASGGADTPDAAMEGMIEALNNEDFIALGELIEPSERRTIVEPTITQVLPELERIGVFSGDLDAGDVGGVDFEFTEVTHRIEPVEGSEDIVHVFFTGGEVAREFNSVEFPFSDRIRDEFGDDLAENDGDRQVDQLQETGEPIVLVERDGRWYFSGWFTLAENARLLAGERLPLASEAPPTLGSDSPEAAVEALMAEITEYDLAGIIGRMDPDEMAALYRYSPLFLDEGQEGLDELERLAADEGISWDIRDLDLDASTNGDDATVSVRGFTVDVQTPDADVEITYGREQISGEIDARDLGRGTFEVTPTTITVNGVIDGEPFSGEITIDPDAAVITGSGDFNGESGSGDVTFDPEGVCSRFTISVSGETDSLCIEDELDADEADALALYEEVFEQWPTEFPGFDMSARRTDGEWYVSPIGTTFDAYLQLFGVVEDDQFGELLDNADLFDPVDAMEDAGVLGGLGLDELAGNDDTEVFVPDAPVPAAPEVSVETTITLSVDPGATANLDESISESTFDLASIDLEAGDTITATVEGSFDTTLELLLDGRRVDFNDDATTADLASSLDSQLITQVTETGTYELRIGSFNDSGAGDYSLSVSRAG